jgi:hypothetical protein
MLASNFVRTVATDMIFLNSFEPNIKATVQLSDIKVNVKKGRELFS